VVSLGISRHSFLGGGLFVVDGNLASSSLLLSDSVLGTSGFSLGLELGVTLLVSLILVDHLDESVLVLVHVTLSSEVHLSVLGRSDLLGLSVLAEESSENSRSSHPEDLGRHTGVSGSLPSSGTGVTSLTDGGVPGLNSESRVDSGLSLFNDVVLNKLADVLAGVSESDLIALSGVNVDAFLSAFHDSSC